MRTFHGFDRACRTEDVLFSLRVTGITGTITEGYLGGTSGTKLLLRARISGYTFVILAPVLSGDTLAWPGFRAMFSRLPFKSERRRRTRQILNTKVRVSTTDGTIEALGINISDVGMGLFTLANLPVGSEIQVELPFENAEVARIPAIVRYRALYLYGVEFHQDSGQNSDVDRVKASTRPGDSLGFD